MKRTIRPKKEYKGIDKSILKLRNMWDLIPVEKKLPIEEYEIHIPRRDELKGDERVTPLSDRIFKFAFQNEDNWEFTCKLVSCVTGLDYDYILENMSFYKNTVNESSLKDIQRSGDLYVKIKGELYQIEMNNYKALGRNIKSSILSSGIRTPDKKDVRFTPILEIDLNNYRLKGIEESISVYANMNIIPEKNNDILLKTFYVEIYLPIIMKKEYNELNETERILRAMFTPSRSEGTLLSKGDKILMKFSETLENAESDSILMEEYDYDLAMRDSLLNKGRTEGRNKGRIEGKEEEKREIIKNMLTNDFDVETISKCVNLKISEVEKIISSIRNSKDEEK